MITELHGLKVKAIAVEVPDYANNLIVRDRVLLGQKLSVVGVTDYVYPDLLPPGSWKILGRVLDVLDEQKMIETLYQTTAHMYAWAQWQKYCAKHGLTNELLLIESA